MQDSQSDNNPGPETVILRQIDALLQETGLVPAEQAPTLAARLQNLVQDTCDYFQHSHSPAALDLMEQLLAGHQSLLERVDDIDGLVRDALHRGVAVWLELASVLRPAQPQARNWVDKVRALFEHNPAGLYDQIIANSGGLLSIDELRQLAWRYESEVRQAIKVARECDFHPGIIRSCLALRSVGIALSDIALIEKSITLANPTLTTLQLAEIVQLAIRLNERSRAEYWLRQPQWQQDSARRQALEQALRSKFGESRGVKNVLLENFIEDPSALSLGEYMQDATPTDIETSKPQIIAILEQHDDSCESVEMLMQLGEVHHSAELLITNELEARSILPANLLRWAQVFEAHSEYLAAILCYRFTIRSLLAHRNERDWPHITNYLQRLQVLDRFNPDYRHFRDCHSFVEWIGRQTGSLRSENS